MTEVAVPGKKVRVGIESSGNARWFERLLGDFWAGPAAPAGLQIAATAMFGESLRRNRAEASKVAKGS